MIRIWNITSTQNIKLDIHTSSLDDLAPQLPDGYYSTFRTYDECRRVLGLAAHLRRLYEPVPTPEVDESHLRRQLYALLEPYRPGEARVRAIMTIAGKAYIAIQQLEPLPREIYERGVRVETTKLQRQQPRLKSTTFIARSDAERKHIAEEGIFEALLVKEGKILEGMTSNFFYIPRAPEKHRDYSERNKPKANVVEARAPNSLILQARPAERRTVLCTAREDILLGITRQTVIDLAQEQGAHVKYEPLQCDQIESVDEAFITSSSRGIVPVVRIDNFTVGQGSPGRVTRDLMAAYEAYVTENAEKI